MLVAGEAFLLGEGRDAPIDDEAGGGVVVVRPAQSQDDPIDLLPVRVMLARLCECRLRAWSSGRRDGIDMVQGALEDGSDIDGVHAPADATARDLMGTRRTGPVSNAAG